MKLGLGLGLSRKPTSTSSTILANTESYNFTSYPATINYGSHINVSYSQFSFTNYPATITAASSNPVGYGSYTPYEWVDVGPNGYRDITTHTIATNNNRLLVCVVCLRMCAADPDNAIQSITWAGNSLLPRIQTIQNMTDFGGRTHKLYLYDLTGSLVTTGNNTLRITWTGSDCMQTIQAYIADYYNIASGSGNDYVATNSADSTVDYVSRTITPNNAGNLIVVSSTASNDTSNGWTHDASLTELNNTGTETFRMCYSHDTDSGGSPLTYDEDFDADRKLATIGATYSNV